MVSVDVCKTRLFLQTCAEGDMPALIEKVPGFKKHIRVFIVHTLATTFQSVTRQNMEQCLDLVSGTGQQETPIWSLGIWCKMPVLVRSTLTDSYHYVSGGCFQSRLGPTAHVDRLPIK